MILLTGKIITFKPRLVRTILPLGRCVCKTYILEVKKLEEQVVSLVTHVTTYDL